MEPIKKAMCMLTDGLDKPQLGIEHSQILSAKAKRTPLPPLEKGGRGGFKGLAGCLENPPYPPFSKGGRAPTSTIISAGAAVKKQITACSLLLLALWSANVFALESDADQPITIDSDTATYDDEKSTSTYIGNVVSIQGSMHVNSDKLVVHFKDGDAEQLVFTGNKAKFRQTPNEGDEDITGEALTGEYYPKKNVLVLINQATVWQGNATYASNYIEYDSKNSIVKAGDKTSNADRVHVTLKPKDKSKPKAKKEGAEESKK